MPMEIESTLVIGDGPCARRVASKLEHCGLPHLRITPDNAQNDRARDAYGLMARTRVEACDGWVGDFRLRLNAPSGSRQVRAGHVVIAVEHRREPTLAAWGLEPSPVALSLSALPGAAILPGRTVALLIGLHSEGLPHDNAEALRAALKLQVEQGCRTVLFHRNLKVAADGLEALSLDVRRAGVRFVKLPSAQALRLHPAEHPFVLTFQDEVSRRVCRLRADVVVADETVVPSPHLPELALIFKLHTDACGFLQSDNVHRLGVYTNRRGIFAAGPARRALSPEAQLRDADQAVLAVVDSAAAASVETAVCARIDPELCIGCLTCLRLCPHAAVFLNERPTVASAACTACGLCAAECPREAITVGSHAAADLEARLRAAKREPSRPSIVVFGCRRSAGVAAAAARRNGEGLPPNLVVVEVPCAGALRLPDLYAALRHRVDGIMTLSCHPGNCSAEYGQDLGRRRLERMRAFLQQIGVAGERFSSFNIAAHMPAEFGARVCAFEHELAALAPRPVFGTFTGGHQRTQRSDTCSPRMKSSN